MGSQLAIVIGLWHCDPENSSVHNLDTLHSDIESRQKHRYSIPQTPLLNYSVESHQKASWCKCIRRRLELFYYHAMATVRLCRIMYKARDKKYVNLPLSDTQQWNTPDLVTQTSDPSQPNPAQMIWVRYRKNLKKKKLYQPAKLKETRTPSSLISFAESTINFTLLKLSTINSQSSFFHIHF